MRIGIIGSGHIGGTAARLFVEAGHEVALCNSRGPESLREQVAALGPKACGMTLEEAVHFGDVVLLAIPWRNMDTLLPVADKLAGKIVVDAMNPYKPDGGIFDLHGSTSSEEVARRIPGARLVKAFNTIYFSNLATRGRKDQPLDERLAIFLAGDDADAKRVVGDLIAGIGFAPVDTGPLREGGRRQEPGSPIYAQPITRAQGREALRELEGEAAGASPG